MAVDSKHPETLALHAGWRADPATGAVAPPIYQTTSYQFHDTEHAANLFALKELGNIYTRIGNPTTDDPGAAARRARRRRRGAGAGLRPGGLGLRAAEPRPGRRQCRHLHRSLWRHLESVRQHAEGSGDRGALRRSDRSREFPPRHRRSRPAPITPRRCPIRSSTVFPIAEVAAIGREFGIPLIVDNTAAPLLVRPFEHGAAIVVYSTTKYIGGHGTSIGGAIIDGGNFDWEKFPDRQPALNTPDPSYHGAVWAEAVKPLGPVAYIIKARTTLLRDLGAALSPFNAFLTLQGIETLPLRIERHVANAAGGRRFSGRAARGDEGDPSLAPASGPSASAPTNI